MFKIKIAYKLLFSLLLVAAGISFNSCAPKQDLTIRDMVLIYDGGAHRSIKWDKEHFAPYVSLENEDGTKDWLFDGFLFLEIHDGTRGFASYYKDLAARKVEWKKLIDNYFREGNAIMALNSQISDVLESSGTKMPTKRKVVITVPEPIPNQTDWGEIDGKAMDFSKKEDRLEACKWFIDYALESFEKANPENLELAGFYWVAEEATNSRDLVKHVADYTKMHGRRLYWIPYFNSDGYNEWEELGFDQAFYQPNYFFNEDRPISQIVKACENAMKYGMSMEMEFDDRALAKNGWGYRMRDYIRIFDQHGVWDKMEVAYYQGGDAFYKLYHSDKAEDNELYMLLAKIIAKRQKVDLEENQDQIAEERVVESSYGKTDVADLVLIYQGGVHRPMEWNKDQFLPYVVHEDQQGNKEWLFDGFLFLEFKDGKGYDFAPGYSPNKARRQEWEWLLDRRFEKGKAISALNACIEEQKEVIGEPEFKHKLISGIPSPILEQKDWGKLNGKTLDFSVTDDRLEAGRWYIDQFLERYESEGYDNLELKGFYWVDEDVRRCADILVPLGDYIRSKGLKFYWIPYWGAKGYNDWEKYQFDFVWIQPNYFFHDLKEQHLNNVCNHGYSKGMGLEMEFDARALSSSDDNRRDKLVDYINAFENNGVYKNASIAYYEGGNGIYNFYKSTNSEDKQLIDRMAKLIIEHRKTFFKKN